MRYLDQALEAYGKSDVYPFHMPGHKRNPLPFPEVYEIDITEIDGFDNLHHAEGILKEAQQRAADLYGSAHCYYLVNGSTCGILASICAAVKKRGRILVARNSHKAVYHALFLSELTAEYLYPTVTECGIQGQITPRQVEDALKKDPETSAVVITSPTYEGVISDIEGIAKVAHVHGIPLIVDSAHGAHLGFGGEFPQNAVRLGADAVIESLHKTLPSFTQTALLHLNSDLISKSRIEKYLGIYETSSPSYILMAGMEVCIRTVKEHGAELFDNYRHELNKFYKNCEDLKRLHVMTGKDLSKEEAFAWDDSKIVIFVRDSSKSGEWLYQELLLKYHLQLEMASGDYALAMTSIMDQEEGYQRLSAALHEIDRELCGAGTAKKQQAMNEKKVRYGNETDGSMENMYEQQVHRGSFIKEVYRPNPQQMQIYEAEEKETAEVSFDEAAGRVSADFIFLYPPGIPLIVPGEAITEEFIERLRTCISLKLNLQGSTDLFAERIKIVYF